MEAAAPIAPVLVDAATGAIDTFAARVVAAFQANDPSQLTPYVWNDGLVSTAVGLTSAPSAMRGELATGMFNALDVPGGFLANVIRHGDGDELVYRGAGIRDGRPVARFRIITTSTGFKFVDVSCRAATGERIANDIWSNGEWLSERLSQMMRQVVPTFEPLAADATPRERAARRVAEATRTLVALVGAQNFERGMATFDALPLEVQHAQPVLRLMVAFQFPAGDPRRDRLADMFVSLFPNDPMSVTLDIDRRFLVNDFVGEAHAIERMIAAVGDDAYLRVLLASAWQSANQLPVAFAECMRAVELEPTLVQAQTTRADIAARLERYDQVTLSVEALLAMDLEPAGIHADAEYAGYRRTADYRRLFP